MYCIVYTWALLVSTVQFPLTRWVFRLLRLALVSWVSFSFAFHIPMFFHSLFFTCHWILFVFLLYNRCICTHSVDLSLTHFFRWVTRLGRGLNLGPCSLMAANVSARQVHPSICVHNCIWTYVGMYMYTVKCIPLYVCIIASGLM